MAITSDNLNLNLNLNLGATAAANSTLGYGGPRYNTEDFPKLNPPNFPVNLALPTPYPADWDPELRTWAYVREFITAVGWPTASDPVTSIYTQLLACPLFVPPTVTAPPGGPFPAAANPLTTAELAHQVIIVLDASIDRADRALEIVDQATGPGALHYWTGMMRIDPSKDKYTFLLMMVALKIGEFVAMGLKDIFKMRRPAQVYPLIMPLIDGPDTPSFPSSHSTQAHLISSVLQLALPPLPLGPPPPAPPPVWNTRQALDWLAGRVAYNREVAGVHYRMDSDAGAFVADRCLATLAGLPGGSLFGQLVAAATPELQNMP
jgi:membrane-associated phospholipid phosphatase